MLGKRSNQRGLFEADNLHLDFVGRDTFYGFLASQRGQLFRDEEFAELYCHDNGCPSVLAPTMTCVGKGRWASNSTSAPSPRARSNCFAPNSSCTKESQLITAATVLAGNAPDHDEALELVEQSEENAQVEVEETFFSLRSLLDWQLS